MIAQMWKFDAPTGAAASILSSNSIPLDSISGLILGHAHFDHFGNLADFPSSMSLLVGPGSHLGEELAQEMDVPSEVIEGRNVRMLSRTEDKWETIGSFKGYDYFGDGSFWVLDIPGVSSSLSLSQLLDPKMELTETVIYCIAQSRPCRCPRPHFRRASRLLRPRQRRRPRHNHHHPIPSRPRRPLARISSRPLWKRRKALVNARRSGRSV